MRNGGFREPQTTASRAKGGLLVLGGFVLLLFIIELFNTLTLGSLTRTFGLRPRSADGLLDIFTFPLLHANLNHLLSNSLPLIIFGFLVFLSGFRVFLTALAFSWLGSGITVWLIGDGGITIGSSGLVFGLFAFLLVRGFFNLFMGYGSILLGMLPIVSGFVSWQAHLGGAAGGVLAALILRPRSGPERQRDRAIPR
jgi:membrane associated rhomboid family serine protease